VPVKSRLPRENQMLRRSTRNLSLLLRICR